MTRRAGCPRPTQPVIRRISSGGAACSTWSSKMRARCGSAVTDASRQKRGSSVAICGVAAMTPSALPAVRSPAPATVSRPYAVRAMSSVVAIDARDAFIEPLRGWGRYARELIGHLPPDLETRVFEQGDIGPEVWFEQVTLPRALRREGAALIHATNCFLPLRRPCPGVVTMHDLAFEEHGADFALTTGAKYRYFAPRAARGAQRVICVSEFTAGDVVRRYGVDAWKIRVVPNAP